MRHNMTLRKPNSTRYLKHESIHNHPRQINATRWSENANAMFPASIQFRGFPRRSHTGKNRFQLGVASWRHSPVSQVKNKHTDAEPSVDGPGCAGSLRPSGAQDRLAAKASTGHGEPVRSLPAGLGPATPRFYLSEWGHNSDLFSS